MSKVRITAPEELPQIVGLIHDRWFDLESVVVGKESGELRVPVLDRRPRSGRLRRWLWRTDDVAPKVAGELRVDRVLECVVDDRAGIRWFDFDGLVYDETNHRLAIRSNFPLEVLVTVEDLDVSLTIE